MPRKRLTPILALIFSFFLVTYSLAANPTPDPATIEKAKNEYLANICAGHGGVNCTIINPDASVTCNDGAIDPFPIIYAVPECQKIIEDLDNQQSDFMTKSGCYPPSEVGCFGQQSYQSLSKVLSEMDLLNSELGKEELTQCSQQIQDYQIKNKDYKLCLQEYNNTEFNPRNDRLVLPILKTIFCPIFYGGKSHYDSAAELCLCDNGYFQSNGQCINASLICQSKYGPDVYAQNGNCIKQTSTFKSAMPSPIIKPKINISLIIKNPTMYRPAVNEVLPEIQPSNTPTKNEKRLSSLNSDDKPQMGNFLKKMIDPILSSFISGLKNMLKLF